MKHPGKKICPSLLITELEKLEKFEKWSESEKSEKWVFELFCSSFKVKLCLKTPLNKTIFETFNLRICQEVL